MGSDDKCWNLFCIATDGDSDRHVDATGRAWVEARHGNGYRIDDTRGDGLTVTGPDGAEWATAYGSVDEARNAIDRARVLTFDEAVAAGVDGTGRDGDPRFPHTYASLTPDERMGVDALNESEAGR